MNNPRPRRWRDIFVRRREVWTLTWPARLSLLALLVGLTLALARHAGTFLAVSEPTNGDYLVVEAWMPPYTYARAAQVWHAGHYRRVIAVRVAPDDATTDAAGGYSAVGSLVRAGIARE